MINYPLHNECWPETIDRLFEVWLEALEEEEKRNEKSSVINCLEE